MPKIVRSPSSVRLVRGRPTVIEVRFDGGTVSASLVKETAEAVGVRVLEVATLDGDNPSAGTHFLVRGIYHPLPGMPSVVTLQNVWNMDEDRTTSLQWVRIASQ
jgi:hypothetical protein